MSYRMKEECGCIYVLYFIPSVTGGMNVPFLHEELIQVCEVHKR